MVSALIIIGKHGYNKYIVRAEDWFIHRLYVIDAQDPDTGDTTPIQKNIIK